MTIHYNPFLVYCRELAPGTVSLTGDRAQGNDSKYDSHYTYAVIRGKFNITVNLDNLHAQIQGKLAVFVYNNSHLSLKVQYNDILSLLTVCIIVNIYQ